MTDEAEEIIHNYYTNLRKQGKADEGKMRSIPINARYEEGIIRLCESCARVRLSKLATEEDAKKATEIVDFCLRQFGFDKETGTYDIDRIVTGISTSTRDKYNIIQGILKELEDKIGKHVPIDDVIFSAKEKGIEEDKVEELLEKMRREGMIYEPRRGFLSKI